MLLVIDAGNTRIKWAIPSPTAQPGVVTLWLAMDSLAHAELDSLPAALAAFPVTRILISNVAGRAIQARLTDVLAQAFPALTPHWFAAQAALAGVRNCYDHPTQLGCDRFASALAARALYPRQNVVIATCGTATTIDALTAEADFLGGMILPGLKLMAESLAHNTAQLPQIEESLNVAQLFASNTAAAIVSGCIHAQVGALSLARQALIARSAGPVVCLISGGAAGYLLPHLGFECEHSANLVLTGLLVVAQSSPD